MKRKLVEHLQRLDAAVRAALGGVELPLLVVGPAEVRASFAGVTRHGTLLDGTSHDLRAAATEALSARREERLQAECTRLTEAAASERYIEALDRVVSAAQQQRLESLMVAGDRQVWGRREDDRLAVHAEWQPGDYDLLDLAAAQALLGGATVHVARSDQVPGPEGAAALLRY